VSDDSQPPGPKSPGRAATVDEFRLDPTDTSHRLRVVESRLLGMDGWRERYGVLMMEVQAEQKRQSASISDLKIEQANQTIALERIRSEHSKDHAELMTILKSLLSHVQSGPLAK
jgi:hypothetical protein